MKNIRDSQPPNRRMISRRLGISAVAFAAIATASLTFLTAGCDWSYRPAVSVSIPQTDDIRVQTVEVVNDADVVVVRIAADDNGNGLLTVFAADGEKVLATLPMK